MSYAQDSTSGRFTYIVFLLILILITAALLAKPVLKIIYPLKYETYIEKYSFKYGLDKHLIMAIISTESKFDENAVSHKGARGLMQLKDETAAWCIDKFDIQDTEDSNELNISVGCAYVNYLIDRFRGNVKTALAAYNAGEGNVAGWLKDQGDPVDRSLDEIPFEETRNYVDRVVGRQKIYKFLY